MIRNHLIVAANPAEAGAIAAEHFRELINTKPCCVLGLATGSTPLPLYSALIEMEKRGEIDFSKVKTVNLDEYMGLPGTHPQSYRFFMEDKLFKHISIKPENTFVPDGLADDVEASCAAYEEKIEELGGIDLQLLGIGHDGHIGFNEPGDFFPKTTHKIALTEMTIEANKRFFDNKIDLVPKAAITMGVGTVMSAKKIVMIATGKGKHDILHKALYGPVSPEVPASILQFHQNCVIICDKDAYEG